MPPQVVTNIIESALLGLPNKKANGARLYRLLDEAKGSKVADGEDLKAVIGGYTWSYSVKNGERPNSPDKNVFQNCAKLKEILVPANCKSWAGMTEWQGNPACL